MVDFENLGVFDIFSRISKVFEPPCTSFQTKLAPVVANIRLSRNELSQRAVQLLNTFKKVFTAQLETSF